MPEVNSTRSGALVLDAFIDALTWDEALARISDWASRRESRYVCICNVHSVVTAHDDAAFRGVVNQADMATPDGMPVAWMLRKAGFAEQQRINGPDLMWKYCGLAANTGQKIFLYGSTEAVLVGLEEKLKSEFTGLEIAGTLSPPFRALTEAEDRDIVDSINASGAGVVFVSLGCPKQEHWMAGKRGKIDAVMIGVGAAFEYHAGTIERAPLWMQDSGLEWLFRLASEPRRLWRRYMYTNVAFVMKAAPQLFNRKK